ncbi:hypothetical protein EK0264_13330 [Epidermidibacterium keratini]|uniref:Uncharacterized protein n=1 Tax=Epidermidibacterium keratini TaxID=1891644 RepID=A0A7L4YRI1_9ACTN|nr:hypothetical protein [Epidermidibacterium keratini]QHC01177.1 hypothetical protein EK0264_13330 [Epidermidibacterium keratini]
MSEYADPPDKDVGEPQVDPDAVDSDRSDAASSPAVRVIRPRSELTAEEREFLRRHAGDRPPHHDSRWG